MTTGVWQINLELIINQEAGKPTDVPKQFDAERSEDERQQNEKCRQVADLWNGCQHSRQNGSDCLGNAQQFQNYSQEKCTKFSEINSFMPLKNQRPIVMRSPTRSSPIGDAKRNAK